MGNVTATRIETRVYFAAGGRQWYTFAIGLDGYKLDDVHLTWIHGPGEGEVPLKLWEDGTVTRRFHLQMTTTDGGKSENRSADCYLVSSLPGRQKLARIWHEKSQQDLVYCKANHLPEPNHVGSWFALNASFV